jgi:hypothetical protein
MPVKSIAHCGASSAPVSWTGTVTPLNADKSRPP